MLKQPELCEYCLRKQIHGKQKNYKYHVMTGQCDTQFYISFHYLTK
jgi:hypothetical protein